MKTRLIIATSFITTVIVLIIALFVFSQASPTMAKSLPSDTVPSLADAHLALPGGGGGGGQVWAVFGWDLSDLRSSQIHDISLGGCRHYDAGSTDTTAMSTVHIPSGATITWMRMNFNDGDAVNNVEVQLRRYIGVSYDYPFLVVLTSSGVSSGSLMAADLSIPVDNGVYMYMVHTDTGAVAGNMEICQIQIGYTIPGIFGSALPSISKP